MKVLYAFRTVADIDEIYEQIGLKSVASAQRVEDAIRRACEGLADFPFATSRTDEPNVRRLPVVRYPFTVFFRIDRERDEVQIIRVVHSRRVKDLRRTPR